MTLSITGKSTITVQEADGSPIAATDTIKFPNGTVTQNADGSVTYTPAASGATSYRSAFASAPGSPASGDLWLPSDSPLQGRYNGSSWDYYLNGLPVTPPTSSTFGTWRNQGSATADTTQGGIYLSTPTSGAQNVRGRDMAATSGSFDHSLLFRPYLDVTASCGAGIYVTDGTKLYTFGQWSVADANPGLYFSGWNSATSFSAHTKTSVSILEHSALIQGVRIVEDATNRTMYVSPDGLHWVFFYQHSKTFFLTTTACGIFVFDNSVATGRTLGMWALSWT